MDGNDGWCRSMWQYNASENRSVHWIDLRSSSFQDPHDSNNEIYTSIGIYHDHFTSLNAIADEVVRQDVGSFVDASVAEYSLRSVR